MMQNWLPRYPPPLVKPQNFSHFKFLSQKKLKISLQHHLPAAHAHYHRLLKCARQIVRDRKVEPATFFLPFHYISLLFLYYFSKVEPATFFLLFHYISAPPVHKLPTRHICRRPSLSRKIFPKMFSLSGLWRQCGEYRPIKTTRGGGA